MSGAFVSQAVEQKPNAPCFSLPLKWRGELREKGDFKLKGKLSPQPPKEKSTKVSISSEGYPFESN